MTIDQYLSQFRILKKKSERSSQEVRKLFDRLEPGSSSNYENRVSRSQQTDNTVEMRLVNLSDAIARSNAARDKYIEFRKELYDNIYHLLYWEGLAIETVYINNVVLGCEDDLRGLDDFFGTNDRRQILSKLDKAKQHLRDNLRAKGVDID